MLVLSTTYPKSFWVALNSSVDQNVKTEKNNKLIKTKAMSLVPYKIGCYNKISVCSSRSCFVRLSPQNSISNRRNLFPATVKHHLITRIITAAYYQNAGWKMHVGKKKTLLTLQLYILRTLWSRRHQYSYLLLHSQLFHQKLLKLRSRSQSSPTPSWNITQHLSWIILMVIRD